MAAAADIRAIEMAVSGVMAKPLLAGRKRPALALALHS